MNSIFKRRLSIINLISIFFLLLIFSCNLKSNLEENKNFDISASEVFLRRLERDLFNIPEKSIKTILERYRDKKIVKIKFILKRILQDFTIKRTLKEKNFLSFLTYEIYEKINGNGKVYLDAYRIEPNGKINRNPITDKGNNIEEEIRKYLANKFIQDITIEGFYVRVEFSDNNEEDLFPREIIRSDIPKLKEILNLK